MVKIALPPLESFAILLGMSFFLGLAYEGLFSRAHVERPGGIRTFPMLSMIGGMLYLIDQTRLIPFSCGLVALAAWLAIFYYHHIREVETKTEPNVGLVIPSMNIFAYTLGAVAIALPPWIAIAMTVVVVLLLTTREKLHGWARGLDLKEIVPAVEFLVLVGVILPLLPNRSITTLTTITPQQAWLALVVVCALSYLSYLAQTYWPTAAQGLWMPALGGLYSSTATTVVLAREMGQGADDLGHIQAGITLASAISYIRFFILIAIFDFPLALKLVAPLFCLSAVGFLVCLIQYRAAPANKAPATPHPKSSNPLQIEAAATFALAFVTVSLLTSWLKTTLGISGIYGLAAVIGVTDIDPFLLNVAQGGVTGLPIAALAGAVLIAASSNNLLKAAYALVFSSPGRRPLASVGALVLLAALGLGMTFLIS